MFVWALIFSLVLIFFSSVTRKELLNVPVTIDVVISAPDKLRTLRRKVNGKTTSAVVCAKKHQRRIVARSVSVFNSVREAENTLGKLWRRTNDRLIEPINYNTEKSIKSHRGIFCRACCCKPIENSTSILNNINKTFINEISIKNCRSFSSLVLKKAQKKEQIWKFAKMFKAERHH